MAAYHWPGNIRELQNVIGNACMMTDGTFIDLDDLPESVQATSGTGAGPDNVFFSLEEAQRRHLAHVLERVGGNKVRAAKVLGIGRTRIYKMLSKMKVAPPDRRV
jgi:transcriptional regulator of acetoin/glycerol metabolism